MTIIVTDAGFGPDTLGRRFIPLEALPANDGAVALHLASDAEPDDLADHLHQITAIRVDFPSFADGRGFTIAARLRRMGFTGHLRAHGHVIADQYAMARRAGFDDVEIPQAIADRQPEDQWLARADWRAHSYQNRLRG
jgi:uncharacterized protein (DUF934 family)